MAILTEGFLPSDIVVHEFDQTYTREMVEVADGETVAVGDCLENSSGEAIVLGDGVCIGVALEAITNATAGDMILAIVRGPATLRADNINGGDSGADPQADLLQLNPPIVLI